MSKIYTTVIDVNYSDSEDKIMSEDENAENAVIGRVRVNRTTPKISGRIVIPSERLKYYKTGSEILDRYKQYFTLTPAEEKFYYQMKEVNE